MIKLITVKDKNKAASTDENGNKSKLSACELRLQKEFGELQLPPECTIHFPEGEAKQTHFEVTICPRENIYRGGKFLFEFNIPVAYPHEAPKVLCKTKVFHPNLDLEGKICLNILREDWKPVLGIRHIVLGLIFLFVSPNPEDPLNKEAAQMMVDNPRQFEANVQRSILSGTTIQGLYFPACPA